MISIQLARLGDSMMDRRAFIGSVTVGFLAVPFATRAQKSTRPLIGFLSSASPAPWAHYLAAFRKGLNETGYVEGENVAIEFRWADGQYDRLPAMAADLVRLQVAVLVATGGTTSALAAKAATSMIPIVFTLGRDPVELGVVASLSHPGGNATGISFLNYQLVSKRLGLLRELAPKATLIALISNPNTPNAKSEASNAEQTSRLLGLRLHVLNASTEQEIDAAFASLVQLRASALIVGVDPFFNLRRDQFVARAARYAVPAIYDVPEFVISGGLMSYGANISEVYRQAGVYTGRILKGAKPADLPVQQPTKFDLIINLNTAKALGLTIPQSLLLRADEVIQ